MDRRYTQGKGKDGEFTHSFLACKTLMLLGEYLEGVYSQESSVLD